MGEYVCLRKCFHRGKLYKKGDPYAPLPGEEVPRHFADLAPGAELPKDPTPRLGTKIKAPGKEKPSLKAPGKDAAGTGEDSLN